jgi:membrane-associated phospholipid phosphatase
MTGPDNAPDAAFSRQVLWLSLVLLAPVPFLMVWGDAPTALFFHRFRATDWEEFFAVITNLANGWIWYSLALIGIAAATLRYRVWHQGTAGYFLAARRAGLFMALAMATSGIAENIIKVIVGRDRPRILFEQGAGAFHPLRWDIANASFPSGHSQSITSAMLALACIYPPLRPVFFAVAVLVATSRIIIGAHYASDVLAGAWLGIVAVLWWRRRFERTGVALDMTAREQRLPAGAASPPPPAQSS